MSVINSNERLSSAAMTRPHKTSPVFSMNQGLCFTAAAAVTSDAHECIFFNQKLTQLSRLEQNEIRDERVGCRWRGPGSQVVWTETFCA